MKLGSTVAGMRRFGVAMLLLGLAFIVGCLYGVFGYALPAIERVHDAEAWAPNECRITSAWVRSDFGENATYKPQVTYTWEVDGTTYSGTRFSFIDFSPSEREGQRIVTELKRQGRVPCFVNPDDPEDAVLFRDLTPPVSFWLTTTAGFGMSLFMFVIGVRSSMGTKETLQLALTEAAANRSMVPTPEPPWDGGGAERIEVFTLTDAEPPSRSLPKMAGIAVGWNLVVGPVVYLEAAAGSWCNVTLLLPLVAVGVYAVREVARLLLSTFNAKAELVLSHHPVVLGEPVGLLWRLKGRTGQLDSLTIKLLCEQRVRYHDGDAAQVHTTVLHQEDLRAHEAMDSKTSGEATFEVPTRLSRSWDDGKTEVRWSIVVEGDVASWPDIAARFPVTVVPASAAPT